MARLLGLSVFVIYLSVWAGWVFIFSWLLVLVKPLAIGHRGV